MTDPWGEAHTPNLSSNSAPGLPFLLHGNMSMAEPDAAIGEAAPGRSEVMSDKGAPDRGNSQLSGVTLIEARLSHVLKTVEAAGFNSLDEAVAAYYAESSKENERLRQEQRLNRIRRLPVLLKELHLAAQGWS
jgi:hypothetical protein